MKLMTPIFVILCVCFFTSCATIAKIEDDFQNDADKIRLEHLLYWSELIEEYYVKTGYYPLQNLVYPSDRICLVKIVTKRQKEYLSKGSNKYRPDLDNNGNGFFQEFGVKRFIQELEKGLGKTIEEKYDIQQVPTKSTIGYFYFVLRDGYAIWSTCITCGVTKISTLLMDGYTPSVNIVSDRMKKKVTKSLTREEMIEHPIFKNWMSRPFIKEGYVREVEQKYIKDSKQ